jgi:hypothetical protein
VRTPEQQEELLALEQLSYYLDDLFRVPGTRYRVGLDPLLGLVPGVGDVPTSAASAYIVARAAALGVPRATLARMLVVLVVDAVVGALPLVGDAFDAVWKANARNVRLAETRLDAPERASVVAPGSGRRRVTLGGGSERESRGGRHRGRGRRTGGAETRNARQLLSPHTVRV